MDEIIAKNLAKTIKDTGKSINSLALESGLNRDTIGYILKGNSARLSQLQAIADALEIPLSHLFSVNDISTNAALVAKHFDKLTLDKQTVILQLIKLL